MPVVTKPIQVEHVKISCRRSFDDVEAALVSHLPVLDADLLDRLKAGQTATAADVRDHGPSLFLFLKRQHGELLAIEGKTAKAVQYEIGNPVTAESMTRARLEAGLYAPLRVLLYEDAQGLACFEYDRPSSLFSQFGDETVSGIGRDLDTELEGLLLEAAG